MAYYGFNANFNSGGFPVNGTGEATFNFTANNGAGNVPESFIGGGSTTLNLAMGDYRARNNTLDRRLTSTVYKDHGSAPGTVTITLPEGAGTYKVWVAAGDADFARADQQLIFQDGVGGSTLLTVSGSTSAGGQFRDANSVQRSSTDWVTYAHGGGSAAAGAATLTFSTAIMHIVIGNASGSGVSCINHVGWELDAGGGGSATGAAAHYYRQLA